MPPRGGTARYVSGLAAAVLLLLGPVACSSDDDGSTSGVTSSTASITSSPPATEPATVSPSTTADPGIGRAPSDGSTMDDPTIGVARSLGTDRDLCEVVDADAVAATPFGDVTDPEPMADTVPGSDGCRFEGINHGEITFAVAPLAEFEGTPSPDGTWELLGGNTACVFCNDDEGIDDQACAAFVALDDDSMLTLFVFLPSNSLGQLGDTTRRLASLVLDGLAA